LVTHEKPPVAANFGDPSPTEGRSSLSFSITANWSSCGVCQTPWASDPLGAEFLQAQVDSNVSSGVAVDTELLFPARLVLSAVLGEEGVDFSEAAGLVAVFSGPRLPFGQLCVQALSALTDELDNGFA